MQSNFKTHERCVTKKRLPFRQSLLSQEQKSKHEVSINNSYFKTTGQTQRLFHEKFQSIAGSRGSKYGAECEPCKNVSVANISNVTILPHNSYTSRTYPKVRHCSMSSEEVVSNDTTTVSQRSSPLSCYECHSSSRSSSDSLNSTCNHLNQLHTNAFTLNKWQENAVGIGTPDFIIYMSQELLLKHSEFFRQKLFNPRNNLIINVGPMNPLALSRAFMWMRDGHCQLHLWDTESLTRLSRHLRIERLFQLCLNFVEYFIKSATNELLSKGIMLQNDILLLQHYLHNATFYPDQYCAIVQYMCYMMSEWKQLPPAVAISSKSLPGSKQFAKTYPNVLPYVLHNRKTTVTWFNNQEEIIHQGTADENRLIESPVENMSQSNQNDSPSRKSSSNQNHSSLISTFLTKLHTKRKRENKPKTNFTKDIDETKNQNDKKTVSVINNEKEPTIKHQVTPNKPNTSRNSDTETQVQHPRNQSPAPSVVTVIPKQKPKITLRYV